MSGESVPPDKLQVLRERVISAAKPAERVKAKLLLADRLSLSDPAAARPFLEQVLAESEKTGLTADGGRAASMLSESLRRAGDLAGSAHYAEVVRKAADLTGDRRGRACWLNLVGMIYQERGEFDRAVECFEEFLQISRETAFGPGEWSAMNQLAGIHAERGQTDKALAYYRQCLEASTKAGDLCSRAIHLHNIGWTLESVGRWAEATEYFHRAVALCEEQGFHDTLLAARMALGELSLKRSDYDSAMLAFSAVVESELETKHSGRLLREALSNFGWTHFRAGNMARAEEILSEVARLNDAAGDRDSLATVERRRAELALAQGRLDAAGELLIQAARHASDLNLRNEQGHVLRVQAGLAAARGQVGPALELFEQAEATLEPLGDTFDLALTRLHRGRQLIDLGYAEEAQTMLQGAVQTFRRLAVVAEAEEAGRLLYRLEIRADRNAALAQGLAGLAALDLAPEQFIERALLVLCDNFRFDQGAVLVVGRPVALRGQPDMTGLSRRRAMLSQTDVELILPVRQNRRLVGIVWLGREASLPARVDSDQLDLVTRALAPSLTRLKELAGEAGRAPDIPGLRFRGVVGCNRQMLEVLQQVPRAAAAVMPVLVQGETGTGKELVARSLHESGPRADHPFVTVNCAAIAESLLEAEVFGVEAGAATGVAARPGKFELADKGTIFLDEIGDMSPALQAKLLRVIEDKTVTRVGGSKETLIDVRVIAASNMDLDLRKQEGKFREDLLYRLNGFRFDLPPLRRRREDMPALVDHFIARAAPQHNRAVRAVSTEVLTLFRQLPWPGNVRQLQHVIARAEILASGDVIEISDLPPELRRMGPGVPNQTIENIRKARRRAADEAERTVIHAALSQTNGDALAAAKLIGCSRAQFYRLLRKHRSSEL